MEGGGAARQEVKSPQEIEEGITSTPTVSWNPFSVFPKEIYLKIFNKLDSGVDKQNFMNAHVLWYALFESERTLFLPQLVFKAVGVVNAGQRRAEIESRELPFTNKDLFKYRLVCKDWDKGIQNYFQLHDNHFTLQDGGQKWDEWLMRSHDNLHLNVPCKTFTWMISTDVENDLEKFQETHPPSKNPILSRSILLWSFVPDFGRPGNLNGLRTSVEALLEIYGQHIWHCEFVINHQLDLEAFVHIAKCLSLMPELKTLSLTGEQAFMRRCIDLSKEDLNILKQMELPQPEMKNLVLLRSFGLPAEVFNKLFGDLPKLVKLQIDICQGCPSSLRDFVLPTDQKNLHEAFFTFKSVGDFKYLYESEAFPNITYLLIKLDLEEKGENWNESTPFSEWPEWRLIFNILEGKFPAVEKLTLALPKAVEDEDQKEVIEQSLECQLNLPKLKELKIMIPNLCSIDFLIPCKALDDLEIVLEHSHYKSGGCSELMKREKLNFNKHLHNLTKSSIWKELPKLRKMKTRIKDIAAIKLFARRTNWDIGVYRREGEDTEPKIIFQFKRFG